MKHVITGQSHQIYKHFVLNISFNSGQLQNRGPLQNNTVNDAMSIIINRVINYVINLILTWFESCIISSATEKTKFAITDVKLYVPIVTLSTQDNAKLLEQLRFNFNWNKYQSKISIEKRNQFFDFLIDLSFQGVNKLSVLMFENEGDRKVRKRYYLPKVEIKY